METCAKISKELVLQLCVKNLDRRNQAITSLKEQYRAIEDKINLNCSIQDDKAKSELERESARQCIELYKNSADMLNYAIIAESEPLQFFNNILSLIKVCNEETILISVKDWGILNKNHWLKGKVL